jgi:hypothetical protein
MTITQGNSGSSTVTVKSQNSYAGTVSFSLSSSSTSLQNYGCYDVGNVTLTAGGTQVTTLTIYTSKNACSSTSETGLKRRSFGTNQKMPSQAHNDSAYRLVPVGALLAIGFILPGIRRRKPLRSVTLGCIMLTLVGASMGCGGSSSSAATSTDVTKGTYSLTLDGTDTSTSSIASSTTFTLTVD